MKKEAILEKVLDILKESIGLEENPVIDNNLSFEENGVDAFDACDFLTNCDYEFKVKLLTDCDFKPATTINEIVDYIYKKLK